MAQTTATDIPTTSIQNTSRRDYVESSSPDLRPCNSLPDRIPHDPEQPRRRPRLANLHPNTNGYAIQDQMALFAGRLGGNQSFVVDRSNPANAELLQKVPDAAPNLSLHESFNLRGFREVDLYKAAFIEFVGE